MTVDSAILGSPPLYAGTTYRDTHMLSVVIPALNEEEGIADIVQRVRAVERGLQEVGVGALEIIVVDDGSTDRTAEIVAAMPSARLLKHDGNRGYGAAIKSGFNSARGDLLAFLDADGTYPPESFPTLCRKLIDQQADVAVGSRRSGADSQMPPVRRVGNFIWSNLVSLLGNQKVADPASGMRIVRREALPQLYPLPDGLHFTPVMSTRSAHEGLRVIEVPVPYAERLGRSKLSVVRDGTRFLTTILWTAMEYNPVRLLGAMGIAALAVVTVITLSLIVLRAQGVTSLGPWGVFSVFAALVLAVAGVSILSLGATFNYLVALFHRRPVKQGLFGPAILTPPLDRQFGWIGVVLVVAGLIASLASLALSLNGWEITRLWFWMLGSAMLILVGMQLTISWVVMRVLEALSAREGRIRAEMDGSPFHGDA